MITNEKIKNCYTPGEKVQFREVRYIFKKSSKTSKEQCDLQTNNGTMVFTRRTVKEARKLFSEGVTISVMTADRNPVDSLTSEIDYTKGEELFWNGEGNIACDFDQVIEDFAEWQKNDGYGHCPDHDAAEKHDFSYWTCDVEQK